MNVDRYIYIFSEHVVFCHIHCELHNKIGTFYTRVFVEKNVTEHSVW